MLANTDILKKKYRRLTLHLSKSFIYWWNEYPTHKPILIQMQCNIVSFSKRFYADHTFPKFNLFNIFFSFQKCLWWFCCSWLKSLHQTGPYEFSQSVSNIYTKFLLQLYKYWIPYSISFLFFSLYSLRLMPLFWLNYFK